jgi:protein O-mannosyl-transferase
MRLNLTKHVFFVLAILTTTLIFYGATVSNEFSLDDRLIFDNIPPKGSEFKDIFSVFTSRFGKEDYRPVSLLTFATEQYVFGDIRPDISHAFNIFFYFLLALVIFYTLLLLPVPNQPVIALLITLLFIAHPSHSGVVSSLKSRDGILSMLFMVAALRYFLLFSESKKYTHILFGTVFFLTGLFSKLDALNLIFILPVLLLIIYKINWKWVLISGYLAYMLHIIFRVLILDKLVPPETVTLQESILYAENPIAYDTSIANKLGLAVSTYWQYLKFMLIPKGYYFYFGFNQIPVKPVYHPVIIIQLLIHLSILLSSFWWYKRSKLTTAGILIFYSCLFYCSNLFTPVGGIAADRYAFIASLGFCTAVVSGIYYVLEKFKIPHLFNTKLRVTTFSATGISVSLIIILLLTYYPFVNQRNKDWKTIFTLFEADLPHLKNSFEANRIASSTYVRRAMNSTDKLIREDYFRKGLQYAKQANKVYPNSIYSQETEGIAYYGLGQIDSAENKFRQTIQKFDTSTVSWDLLGDIYFKKKNYDSAVVCYTNVIRVNPDNNAAYYKIPNTLYLQGKKDSAFAFCTNLMQTYPRSFIPYESISYLYFNEGDTLKGIDFMLTAFKNGYRDNGMYSIIKDILMRKNETEKLNQLDAILFPETTEQKSAN